MTQIEILDIYPNINGESTFRIKLLVFSEKKDGVFAGQSLLHGTEDCRSHHRRLQPGLIDNPSLNLSFPLLMFVDRPG